MFFSKCERLDNIKSHKRIALFESLKWSEKHTAIVLFLNTFITRKVCEINLSELKHIKATVSSDIQTYVYDFFHWVCYVKAMGIRSVCDQGLVL